MILCIFTRTSFIKYSYFCLQAGNLLRGHPYAWNNYKAHKASHSLNWVHLYELHLYISVTSVYILPVGSTEMRKMTLFACTVFFFLVFIGLFQSWKKPYVTSNEALVTPPLVSTFSVMHTFCPAKNTSCYSKM